MQACTNGHESVVKYVLDIGADVNQLTIVSAIFLVMTLIFNILIADGICNRRERLLCLQLTCSIERESLNYCSCTVLVR